MGASQVGGRAMSCRTVARKTGRDTAIRNTERHVLSLPVVGDRDGKVTSPPFKEPTKRSMGEEFQNQMGCGEENGGRRNQRVDG